MDEMSMIILLVPIVFPVIKVLGFDPIWFGVIIVVACELGMITPPVGINVFVINSIVKDVRITTIYGGVLPFILSDIIRLALLVIFPMIALWLPMTMVAR
jgi:TRAP-type C4-dicarboxylate transport system permease large subunit